MMDLISRKAAIDILCRLHIDNIAVNGKRITEFIRELPSVTDTNVGGKWILCNDKMPDREYELYWTTHEDGSIVLHGYTKKNGFIYNWEVDDLELRKRQGGVVAWMLIPMPEPYKGE